MAKKCPKKQQKHAKLWRVFEKKIFVFLKLQICGAQITMFHRKKKPGEALASVAKKLLPVCKSSGNKLLIIVPHSSCIFPVAVFTNGVRALYCSVVRHGFLH